MNIVFENVETDEDSPDTLFFDSVKCGLCKREDVGDDSELNSCMPQTFCCYAPLCSKCTTLKNKQLTAQPLHIKKILYIQDEENGIDNELMQQNPDIYDECAIIQYQWLYLNKTDLKKIKHETDILDEDYASYGIKNALALDLGRDICSEMVCLKCHYECTGRIYCDS